jgi:hypothetical protein
MVLSIIFREDKHNILLHVSIFYEYQQFFQHLICFSIQPQLQLVNLHRNWRYFVIKLHTWFCLSYFLKTNIKHKLYCIYQYFMSVNSFFQHRICFLIQPPDYSDPWPRLADWNSFDFFSRKTECQVTRPFINVFVRGSNVFSYHYLMDIFLRIQLNKER